jgi:hypothetical protein
MQEIRAYCESHGLDFGTVYTDANGTYNAGYQALGKSHLTRPLLKHMGTGIGGHCVRENAALLPDTLFGDLVAQSPRSASPGDYDLPPRDPSPQRLAVLAENP